MKNYFCDKNYSQINFVKLIYLSYDKLKLLITSRIVWVSYVIQVINSLL